MNDAVDDSDAVTDVEEDPQPGGQGRTLLVGGLVVVAFLVVAVVVLAFGADQDQSPDIATLTAPASPGATPPAGLGLTDAVSTLPPATLGGFAGGPDTEVDDLLGAEPLVINFWATWCAPCVAEMPDLQALHEEGEGAFRLVGINTQDAEINAEPFIDDLGITYEQVTDRDGAYFAATGGFGMPTTLFVRPDGSVAFRHTGPLTLEQMRDLVAEHLGVPLASEPR